jgi:hypothetical protein
MNSLVANISSWLILILGFSYIIQARNWILLSREAIEIPHRYYPLFLFLLVLGLAVVSSHNVWVGDWPVVITILGWVMVAKSLVFLLFVQYFKGLASMSETAHLL